MDKYTKADIGNVIVPIIEDETAVEFFWKVVNFARTLGYQDEGVDYTANNYGIGERGFVDDEEWAEARVAYGEAIDFIAGFCDTGSFIELTDDGLTICKHPYED